MSVQPAVRKGDVAGHDFRGNQWTGGVGGADLASRAELTLEGGGVVHVPVSLAAQLVDRWSGAPGPVPMQNMQVVGEKNCFANSARDIPRANMPQLPADSLAGFQNYLADRNVLYQSEDVDPRTLQATQNQLDGRKVGQIYDLLSGNRGDNPIIVSRDNCVLDGHHRWAASAAYALTHDDYRIPVLRVNENIDQLLHHASEFTQQEGLPNKVFGQKAEDNAWKTFESPPGPPPDDTHPWMFIDGKWVAIATDTADGVPATLTFPKPVGKDDPDSGDVHVDGVQWAKPTGPQHSREYLTAVLEKVKAHLPPDEWKAVHAAALPVSGGRARWRKTEPSDQVTMAEFANSTTWLDKAEERQIVYGLVLVPGQVDSQGDVITAADVEAAAHEWALDWQEQGVQHLGDALPEIRPVESYIAPTAFKFEGREGKHHTVPKGSWVMASHIGNPDAWTLAKSGRLSGFSIQGVGERREVS